MTELTIAHISDIHAGSPYFVPSLMDRVVVELNELEPDIVLCTGDLTEMGFRQDYVTAKEYLDRIEAPRIVIPGNHDARNVGYVHFEELIRAALALARASTTSHIVALDSTEPDLDHGQIGRAQYEWLREEFARPAAFRIFMLHHHLLPVPGTGRERNIVYDAGDLLEVLQECGVNLVLSAATSTCPTPGGSSTSSSSTPARAARCVCGATPRRATTSSASRTTGCRWRASTRSTARRR